MSNLKVAPELMKSILSHMPPTRFAMAYGSGIFAQKGYAADSKVSKSTNENDLVCLNPLYFSAHARFHRRYRRFKAVAQGSVVQLSLLLMSISLILDLSRSLCKENMAANSSHYSSVKAFGAGQ